MEFANKPLPQPSSLINNLTLIEEPKNQSPEQNEDQKEKPEEDNNLITYKDNSTYKGSLQDGKKHGSGVLTLSNKDKYMGDFSQDKLEGRGKYEFNDNIQKYEGDWVDNNYNGKCKFIFYL